MDNGKTIFWMLEDRNVHSLESLIAKTKYSERKIHSIIHDLRKDGEKNGFEVITVKNKGYCIRILDEENYSKFVSKMNTNKDIDIGNRDVRILMILYYLLSTKGFCTQDSISKLLDVSRRTITNDLVYVKEILTQNNLSLYSKKHYGIKIIGDEWDIRKLFSKVTNDIQQQNNGYSLNDSFSLLKKDEDIKRVLIETFTKNNILMTTASIDSILLHLCILLFRVKENNYVTDINVNEEVIDERYYFAAHDVIQYLEEKYNMKVSKQEVDLLSSQFFGKSILEDTPLQTKTEMLNLIHQTLLRIDSEYESNYADDKQLIEGLLLHIYPLIMRLSFGLELSNSLIHILPAQYTSAFLVAIRFTEYHPKLHGYSLSRDEIGYLALHFANHQEKLNLKKIQNIKSIAVIYENMRSDSSLLKTKLQITFTNANIKVIPSTNIRKYNLEDIDLILSTNASIPLNKHSFVINEPFDDNEINRIRNAILYNYNDIVHKAIRIKDLFFESLYFHDNGTDYLEVIRKYADLLEKEDIAKIGFGDSVIERETRLNTIYENGIAGPHSIIPYANIDCILIIILDQPIYYEEKKVNCIFLINIRSGHMMLHQSVSRFIVKLMRDKEKIKEVRKTKSFEEFKKVIKW